MRTGELCLPVFVIGVWLELMLGSILFVLEVK
jgi:hypothetical protein